MKLTDWWQILDLYETILVWPLAAVTLYLTLTSRTRRGRIVGAAWLLVWFVPLIHRGIGNVYFDYLCKHEAGEFIYRTVDNVEGILLMRPRDGSKDYFDRMANGDIPEDPWGHTNAEAREPWILFRSYQFIEKPNSGVVSPPPALQRNWYPSMYGQTPDGTKYFRYLGYDGKERATIRREAVWSPRSNYGYTWGRESALLDTVFNVRPGEMRVVSLGTNEVLAVKRGYFRTRPIRLCGGPKDESFAYDFVRKVLKHP